MKGKIEVYEDEVKELVRNKIRAKLSPVFRITEISAKRSYSLDMEVEFTDEQEPEVNDRLAELFHEDIPDEAA